MALFNKRIKRNIFFFLVIALIISTIVWEIIFLTKRDEKENVMRDEIEIFFRDCKPSDNIAGITQSIKNKDYYISLMERVQNNKQVIVTKDSYLLCQL